MVHRPDSNSDPPCPLPGIDVLKGISVVVCVLIATNMISSIPDSRGNLFEVNERVGKMT